MVSNYFAIYCRICMILPIECIYTNRNNAENNKPHPRFIVKLQMDINISSSITLI
ncbi:hypothetical protein HanRHA438_Chr03g0148941 [Helianthus annuus]|nr:hypothetical protein HanRHA438_Chr03g0148941 [Helianthus annuus]